MVFMNFGILNTYNTRVGDDFVTNLNVSNSYSMYIDYKQNNECIVIIKYFSKA